MIIYFITLLFLLINYVIENYASLKVYNLVGKRVTSFSSVIIVDNK